MGADPNSKIRRVGLYAGGFLGPFGGGMVVVLIPEFRDAFDVSTATASLALTAYLVPFALLQLVSGTVGERIGRDRVLRVALLIHVIGSLGSAIFLSIVPFLISRAIQGAANAFITPLVVAKLADKTPEESIGRAMGTLASVQTSGVVMAPLIGGLAGAIDYRLAFVASAIAALILFVIVPEKSVRPDHEIVPSIRSAITERTRWLMLSAAFFFMCTVGLGVVISLRAADEFGIGPDARGLLLASFGFAGVLVGRPAGGLLDRIGVGRVLVLAITAAAGMLVCLGLANNEWVIAGLWFVLGGAGAAVATSLNTLNVSASQKNRGGAISMIAAFRFAGAAIAPVIWIPLYHVNVHLAFIVAACGMAFVWFGARRAITARTV